MSTVAKKGLPRMPVAPPLPKAPPITRVAPPLVELTLVPERLCDWCRASIAQDASVCPHCRKARKGMGKAKDLLLALAITAVVLFMFLFFLVVGAGYLYLNGILSEARMSSEKAAIQKAFADFAEGQIEFEEAMKERDRQNSEELGGD